MASRNEVWKTEGVSTFSLGVLVRGHGIYIFCCLFVVRLCIYMFGWLCRATCCSVISTSMVYHMLSKTRRSSGSLHRVIGEVLVLGLLEVVCKIPYSSCMFSTAVVLESGKM